MSFRERDLVRKARIRIYHYKAVLSDQSNNMSGQYLLSGMRTNFQHIYLRVQVTSIPQLSHITYSFNITLRSFLLSATSQSSLSSHSNVSSTRLQEQSNGL